MAQNGGRRPGAGRPKGIPNKSNALREKRVAAEGITPLDYMLKVMRDEDAPRDVRMDAAKAAASYVHPRLSSVEASVAISSHEDFINECDVGEGEGGSASAEV